MTSPPAKHDPADDGQRREDAGAHPPLGQVEAGPQRHSAARPWIEFIGEQSMELHYVGPNAEARYRLALASIADAAQRLLTAYDAALRSVDRAAREECARIADDLAASLGDSIRARGAVQVRNAIIETIKY